MKRGVILLALLLFVISLNFSSAQYYYGTSGFAGLPSIADLINNEWVNAAIIFLFIFAFVWFVLQQVFKANLGSAIVLSIILALVGALGVVYLYGPILAKFGNLIFFVICAAIILMLWLRFRHAKTIIFIALALVSLIWLLFLRRQLCPPEGLLFQELCVILDVIAIILLIICIIKLLWALFRWLSRGVRPGGPGPGPGPEPEYRILTINVRGNGTTNPSPGARRYRLNQNVRVRAIPARESRFEYWILDGEQFGNATTINVIMNEDHTLVAVFSGITPPISANIEANPSRIAEGQSTTLTWTTRNADSAEIKGIGKVPLSGSRIVWPKSSTTYQLIARNTAGQVATDSCTVEVRKALPPPGAPKITLVASPTRVGRGVPVTLKWKAENAERVILVLEKGKQVRVNTEGSYVVRPPSVGNQPYSAIAINQAGKKAMAKVVVTVMEALPGPVAKKALTYDEKKMLPPPGAKQGVKPEEIREIENLRRQYEQFYKQKQQEKSRLQKEMQVLIKQQKHLEKEIKEFKRKGLHTSGQEIQLREVNTQIASYMQKLKTLDSEMKEIVKKAPRR